MATVVRDRAGGLSLTGRPTVRPSGCRKWWLLAAGALGWLAAGGVQAQFPLPFYEPFPTASYPYLNNGFSCGYVSGEQLGKAGSSGNIWGFGNSTSSSSSRISTAPGLQYPGLTNVDAGFYSGYLYLNTGSTGSKDRGVLLNIPANQTIYASCLINIQTDVFSAGTVPWPLFGLTPPGTSGSGASLNGAVVYVNNAFQLQVAKNSSTPAPAATAVLVSSNTHLVVVSYKVNPGANDEVDLWLDPVTLGGSTAPAPTLSTTNNANVVSGYFGGVAIYNRGMPPALYVDEIRVGTSWADVTPAFPAPGNSYTVTGGGAGCSGASFNIGLSGSDAGVTYYLFTNSAPAGLSVAGTGLAISFGSQSATAVYTVLGSNTVTSYRGWMNGSATVSVVTPPVITAQPSPLTVPSGELGAFTVGYAGSAQSCQWYRNGVALTNGNEFSGVQTTSLVIFPVTAADAATSANGYYAVISDSCGDRVTSVTNALSLGTPADLVWSGSSTNSNWDVKVSRNWNAGATYFNYGDNVTFDDTTTYCNVMLNNSYLSPSTMTINGSVNSYTFSGNGGLAGSGRIIMNSTAEVALTAPNTQTGGLVLNSGLISFNTAQNLGTGIITLAGGTLDAVLNLDPVYINNQIDVTAPNSTIMDSQARTGRALILTNLLNGISGDLTFYCDASKATFTPVIELTYPGFTFNLPVILDLGGNGALQAGFTVAGRNTSGTQVWNGVISGGGGLQRNGTGGQTVLAGANTYSGDTVLSAGRLGVASDSVLESGSLVSGPLGVGYLRIDTDGTGPEIYAAGGPHTVANPIYFSSEDPGTAPFALSGTNELRFAGDMDLSLNNRTIEVSDTAGAVFSGNITDNGYGMALFVTGSGPLYLDGTASCGGGTIHSGNLLAGTGSLSGLVTVLPGATLGAGDPAGLGTLTLNGGLSLGGNVFVRVNKSLVQSNDLIAVNNSADNVGSGTVIIRNLGPVLAVGDRFVLFSQPLAGGSALTIRGGGMTWNNNLALDGSISALSVAPPAVPPLISATFASGGNLVFAGTNGTADGTYYVLTTTNLAAPLSAWTVLSTNVFGAGGVFSVTNSIDGATPSRFFTLSVPVP